MPAPAENLNAFDLKLLKALINFKINKDHHKLLTVEDKRRLCSSYGEGGTLTLSPDYLVKVFPKRDEIRRDVTVDTLNQLCSILRKEYRWHVFTSDINRFRPEGIPDDKPYLKLNATQQEKIERAIKGIFFRYRTFQEFEKEVIDKVKMYSSLPGLHIQSEDGSEVITAFAHRIHIELSTRKAAIPIDEKHDVIEEVYDSWYKLFCIIRDELKSLPVPAIRIQDGAADILNLTAEILNEVLRPHLTEHQAKFRKWMKVAKNESRNKKLTPQELQKKYPDYNSLMKSIKDVNKKLIRISDTFIKYLN